MMVVDAGVNIGTFYSSGRNITMKTRLKSRNHYRDNLLKVPSHIVLLFAWFAVIKIWRVTFFMKWNNISTSIEQLHKDQLNKLAR